MTDPILRFARIEDAEEIAAIYAPSVIDSAISFEVTPPMAKDMQERMATIMAYAPWLVCEIEGKVEGYAYLSRHRERAAYQWSLDAAVYVSAERRRSGIGRALYTALFSLAKLQGYYAVHAGITLPNPASVALHEALGFEPVGVYAAVGYKHGAWRDVGWWQLTLRERHGEPAPPLLPEQARLASPDTWKRAMHEGQHLLR
jgi:phosphinothricin acetyltransferase